MTVKLKAIYTVRVEADLLVLGFFIVQYTEQDKTRIVRVFCGSTELFQLRERTLIRGQILLETPVKGSEVFCFIFPDFLGFMILSLTFSLLLLFVYL